MNSLKVKSIVIGMLIGAGIVFFLGATESINGPGRYQIGATDNHVLILDTHTGVAKHFDTLRNEIKIMDYTENTVKTIELASR